MTMLKTNKLYFYLFFFLMTFIMYLFTASGHIGGDLYPSYLQTEALVENHSFQINLISHHWPDQFTSHTTGQNDKYNYTEIGMTLVYIPFYIMGKIVSSFIPFPSYYTTMFFCSLSHPFLMALSVVLLFYLLSKYYCSPQKSMLLTLSYGFTTIIWVFAKNSFRVPLLIVLLLLIFIALEKIQETKHKKYFLLLGLAFGLLVNTKSYFILFLPSTFIYLIYLVKKRDFVKILYTAIPFTLFLLLWFLYNYIRFGSIFNFYGQIGQSLKLLFDYPIMAGLTP